LPDPDCMGTTSRSSMITSWRYQDIVDLEYFFRIDSNENQKSLQQRDRQIYLESGIADTADPKILLLHWLQTRRDELFSSEKLSQSPGFVTSESVRLLTLILSLVGVAGGVLSGLAFFTYSGTTPVNVFHFLTLFIFTQLALLGVLCLTLFLRLVIPSYREVPSLPFRLYGFLANRFMSSVQRRIRNYLPAEQQNSYEQTYALFWKAGRKYGRLMFWPLFTISQKIMVSINAGLIAATCFRVVTSDIAFGWQSTLQISSEAIYRLVMTLARPWSWLIPPEHAYPSLEQIEGSRIILKDGIYNLATQDLVSWWPFLILCLLCYGLIFRLILVSAGMYIQHRSLRTFQVETPESQRLIRRMLTPLVSTQAEPVSLPPNFDKPGKNHLHQPHTEIQKGAPILVTLLVPDDIAEPCQSKQFTTIIEQFGFQCRHVEIIQRDYESDQLVLQKLGNRTWQNNNGVLIIIEAWMPPIGDLLNYLNELRRALGEKTPIFVGLIGKQQGQILFSAPLQQDITLWRQKLDGLKDPYLDVFALINQVGQH